MHVGINLSYLRPKAVGGSEVYVRELISRLARLPGTRVTVFCWDEAAASFANDQALEVIVISTGRFSQLRRLIVDNISLAQALRKTPVDVLFSPANFAAPLLPCRVPQVATVHDFQHAHIPECFTAGERLFRTALFRATFLRCRRIIAISDATRQDAMLGYGLKEDRIVTVLEGVSHSPPPEASECEAVRVRYDLPETYFFYPAMTAPHKNHKVLLDALRALRADSCCDAHLVFSGARTEHYTEVERNARELGLADYVHHIGFLPREDVFPVLASSRGLVFPSLFEGFGLPVLEAMQCNVPVIAANTTSIPEVAGDAAILLPPEASKAWAAAMATMLCDELRSQELVALGRTNIKKFSWDRCARETLAVFNQALRPDLQNTRVRNGGAVQLQVRNERGAGSC